MEGNAIEVVRWLLEHYGGRVTWLVGREGDVEQARRLLGDTARAPEIRRAPNAKSVLRFLRAEVFFFTYVLYGAPRPEGRRIFVNLWHGDGPKSPLAAGEASMIPAHATVSGARMWGFEKVRAFGCPEESLIVCGNPRIDQYRRPATDSVLRQLGLDAGRPIILWAPTYRHARESGARRAWSDSARAFPFDDLIERIGLIEQLEASSGLQLVVKPHPLDAARFSIRSIRAITDGQLAAANVTLYQLLARAAALVTDYSSIWTDYLPLDRPVGFYCPDIEEYGAGRGFTLGGPDQVSLPGPLLRDVAQLARFLRRVVDGDEDGGPARRHAAETLGIVTELGATERLMEELARRDAWPARRGPETAAMTTS
jgi:hypothetical protein